MPALSSSFTSVSNAGLLFVLQNKCRVSQAFDPGDHAVASPQLVEFDAIWDTGATGCVITQPVVDACGLKPITMVKVHGVHGEDLAEVYLVNIYLPNHVAFPNVHVTKGKLPGTACMLIGMNIINRGDFAVTNLGGLTKFSFRYPSRTHIDFVEEHNQALQREQSGHGGSHKHRKNKQPKTYGKNKRKKK
jgi:hypothetical protein